MLEIIILVCEKGKQFIKKAKTLVWIFLNKINFSSFSSFGEYENIL